MNKLRPVATPIEKQTLRERRSNEPLANQLEYKDVIGSIRYVTTIPRPHISYTTEKLIINTKNPSCIHLVGVKQILLYLSVTAMIWLCLYNDSTGTITGLVNYADANYAGGNEESKSTSGILIKYRNCTVHWRSENRHRHCYSPRKERSILWLWALWNPRSYGISLDNVCSYPIPDDTM